MFTRKEIFNLVLIAILVISIPAAVFFIRQQQVLKSKAAPGAVIFAGPIKTANNKTVAMSENIQIQVKSPFEASNPSPTLTPTSTGIPTPTSASVPTPTPVQNSFTPTDPPSDLGFGTATIAGPALSKVGQATTYNMKSYIPGGKGISELYLAHDQATVNGRLQPGDISAYDQSQFNCNPRVDDTGNCAWYRVSKNTYTAATEQINSSSATVTFLTPGDYVLIADVVPEGRKDLACSNNPFVPKWPVATGGFTFWYCSGQAVKIKVTP